MQDKSIIASKQNSCSDTLGLFFNFIIAAILSLALQTGEVSFHTSVYQTAPHRTKEEEAAYEEE